MNKRNVDTLALIGILEWQFMALFPCIVPGSGEGAGDRCRRRHNFGIIPAAQGADWYARGVGGAAAGEINKIPAARPSIEESMFRAAGISCHRQGPTRHE
jgi:hypothetical protein